MGFSKAQFESVINDITGGMADFSAKLDQIGPVATAAANSWYVPEPVAKAIIWLADESIKIGHELLDLLVDLLKGAVAPILMFSDAWQWGDVRGIATGTASALTNQNLVVDDSDWSGKAKNAYTTAAGAQSKAADKVGSIEGNASITLILCAAAGTAFYVTLAAVVAKLLAAAIAAIAAFGSAVLSWAGAAIILEEAGVNTAIIATAAATLTTFLTAQAGTMVRLHSDTSDNSAFPNGAWPLAGSAGYDDGTVMDGDADWSLAG